MGTGFLVNELPNNRRALFVILITGGFGLSPVSIERRVRQSSGLKLQVGAPGIQGILAA